MKRIFQYTSLIGDLKTNGYYGIWSATLHVHFHSISIFIFVSISILQSVSILCIYIHVCIYMDITECGVSPHSM